MRDRQAPNAATEVQGERAATRRQASLIALARGRNTKNVRSAILIAALLALLLWQTRWPSLRAGLIVLLVGQLGSALILLYRNSRLAAELAGLQAGADITWFDGERAFLNRFTLLENSMRLIGFLLLGYGFWMATRNLLIAFLLGVIYPVVAYFGMVRRNHLRAVSQLSAQKEEVQKLAIAEKLPPSSF